HMAVSFVLDHFELSIELELPPLERAAVLSVGVEHDHGSVHLRDQTLDDPSDGIGLPGARHGKHGHVFGSKCVYVKENWDRLAPLFIADEVPNVDGGVLAKLVEAAKKVVTDP